MGKFTSFMSNVGDAIIAAGERVEERARLEREESDKVLFAIREYEAKTGRAWVDTRYGSATNRDGSRSIWNPAKPGHLTNCREYCMDKHCVDCGDSISVMAVRCNTCKTA